MNSMSMAMRSARPSFWQDDAGVSAVEFAVVAPVLLLLMFGIIEFATIMLVANMMENATSLSSRLGKTGYAATGQSRADTIRASIIARAGGFVNGDRLEITSTHYEQFDQIGDAEPWNDANTNGLAEAGEYDDINGNGQYDADMGLAGFGDAEDIVVYTIRYPWGIMTPIMREIIGDAQGEFPITARAVVKNEPYDD